MRYKSANVTEYLSANVLQKSPATATAHSPHAAVDPTAVGVGTGARAVAVPDGAIAWVVALTLGNPPCGPTQIRLPTCCEMYWQVVPRLGLYACSWTVVILAAIATLRQVSLVATV
jgi:hypothetical protein